MGQEMPNSKLFQTQRRAIIAAYEEAGQPFSASTKPYKSTVAWQYLATNPLVTSTVGWLVCPQGQRLEYFGYKISDPLPGAQATYRSATEADTNVSKARTTNGAEDFVIEGISASHARTRVSFTTGALASTLTDPTVVMASLGTAVMVDSASIYTPPQVYSPFNLEDALYRAMAPIIAVEFEWDRSKVVKIGTLEQLPEGAANSYLRSSGEPSTNDRYRIPEGYLWRREGQPDSEFIVRGFTTEPVTCPYLMVSVPNNTTTPSAAAPINAVWLDSLIRLHGLSVKLPTRN